MANNPFEIYLFKEIVNNNAKNLTDVTLWVDIHNTFKYFHSFLIYQIIIPTQVYYCDEHKEATVYSSLDWTFVVLCLLILMVNVFGTTYDYVVNKAEIDMNHDKG